MKAKEDEGHGTFLACGKVVDTLLQHLAYGRIDGAAALLATCTANVGDEMVEKTLVAGANKSLSRDIARMFLAAKDYGRAALCAQQAGDHALAAECFEANYEWTKAAEHHIRGGDHSKAAALFERGQNFQRAAQLFLHVGDLGRAADSFERAKQYFESGELHAKTGRFDKAVELLQRVGPSDVYFARAVLLLGGILERMGSQALGVGALCSGHPLPRTWPTQSCDQPSIDPPTD